MNSGVASQKCAEVRGLPEQVSKVKAHRAVEMVVVLLCSKCFRIGAVVLGVGYSACLGGSSVLAEDRALRRLAQDCVAVVRNVEAGDDEFHKAVIYLSNPMLPRVDDADLWISVFSDGQRDHAKRSCAAIMYLLRHMRLPANYEDMLVEPGMRSLLTTPLTVGAAGFSPARSEVSRQAFELEPRTVEYQHVPARSYPQGGFPKSWLSQNMTKSTMPRDLEGDRGVAGRAPLSEKLHGPDGGHVVEVRPDFLILSRPVKTTVFLLLDQPFDVHDLRRVLEGNSRPRDKEAARVVAVSILFERPAGARTDTLLDELFESRDIAWPYEPGPIREMLLLPQFGPK